MLLCEVWHEHMMKYWSMKCCCRRAFAKNKASASVLNTPFSRQWCVYTCKHKKTVERPIPEHQWSLVLCFPNFLNTRVMLLIRKHSIFKMLPQMMAVCSKKKNKTKQVAQKESREILWGEMAAAVHLTTVLCSSRFHKTGKLNLLLCFIKTKRNESSIDSFSMHTFTHTYAHSWANSLTHIQEPSILPSSWQITGHLAT